MFIKTQSVFIENVRSFMILHGPKHKKPVSSVLSSLDKRIYSDDTGS